jgi:hypothetical protein
VTWPSFENTTVINRNATVINYLLVSLPEAVSALGGRDDPAALQLKTMLILSACSIQLVMQREWMEVTCEGGTSPCDDSVRGCLYRSPTVARYNFLHHYEYELIVYQRHMCGNVNTSSGIRMYLRLGRLPYLVAA